MIFRTVKNRNNPYFQLNRTACNDERLSYKAVGIHTYLMSKPDNWTCNEDELAARHTDGKAAVRSGIRELLAHGYMVRVQVRKDKKIIDWRLDVYETPELNPYLDPAGEPKTVTIDLDNLESAKCLDSENHNLGKDQDCENQDVGNRNLGELDCENQDVGKQDVGNRTHKENRSIVKTDQNDTDANASGAVGAGLTSPAENRSSLSDQFQALLAELKTTKNRSAKLWEIYTLCFGRHEEMPSYGRLGKVATQVGGAGRLAQLFWELSARPPTGDVLSYIQKTHAKKGRESHGTSNNAGAGWQPYHSDQIITTVDINRDVPF
jgi:hypothetical protein